MDQFDGGTVVLTGTWRPGDGTLGLDYEEMQLELFASLPLLGNITIGILQEDLGTGAETSTTFDCAVDGDELRLRGSSLTLGVPLAQEAAGQIEDDPAFAELSGIARAALAQLGSVIGQAIRNNSLDRVVLVRVR